MAVSVNLVLLVGVLTTRALLFDQGVGGSFSSELGLIGFSEELQAASSSSISTGNKFVRSALKLCRTIIASAGGSVPEATCF